MQIICCPKCGYLYLPSEIYLPDYFLGKPNNIVRDEIGKILMRDGIDQDLEEEYTCNNCNEHFYVKANIDFEVKSGNHATKIVKKK